jgi:hypothetical protein
LLLWGRGALPDWTIAYPQIALRQSSLLSSADE